MFRGLILLAVEPMNLTPIFLFYARYVHIQKSQDIQAAFLVKYLGGALTKIATMTRSLPLY